MTETTKPNAEAPKAEENYPCYRCGAKRTKAEGGTVFTVCEDCWNRTDKGVTAEAPKVQTSGYIVPVSAGQEWGRIPVLPAPTRGWWW